MTPVYGINPDRIRKNRPAAGVVRFVLSWITKLVLVLVFFGGLLLIINAIENAI